MNKHEFVITLDKSLLNAAIGVTLNDEDVLSLANKAEGFIREQLIESVQTAHMMCQ